MTKQGDMVWIQARAGLVMPDGTVWPSDLRGAPIKGCLDNRHLPDHPALPAVAAWLAEHPGAFSALTLLFDEADWRASMALIDNGLDAMRSLLSALAPSAAPVAPEREVGT